MTTEHFDYLILGGGLSGICAAVYYLKEFPGANCPTSNLRGCDKTMAIFEGRDEIGGTWDLFKYPGIRSDSSMVTFAYSFKPWTDMAHMIAPAHLIKQYLIDTANEFGVMPHIRTGHRATKMSWNSEEKRWTILFSRCTQNGEKEMVSVTANFLQLCTGYYQYEKGYTPTDGAWATMRDDFKGEIIHPQLWPKDFNWEGKRVVVIGSGATAITLVPVLAEKAKHVTMLQRSPTWMISLNSDRQMPKCLRWLPSSIVSTYFRGVEIFLGWAQFVACRAFPNLIGKYCLSLLTSYEKLSRSEVAKNFTPKYKLWDERFCVVTNGDLFKKIRAGSASVVTAVIERFVANGIELKSTDAEQNPEILEADVIVTATGLNIQLLGGAIIEVDGVSPQLGDHLVYRGTMISGIPNLAFAIGYTNASWTLKVELSFQYITRLLSRMDRKGEKVVVPTPDADVTVTDQSVFDLASNYVKRGKHMLPRQGSKAPWIVMHSYFRDYFQIGYGNVHDRSLVFSK